MAPASVTEVAAPESPGADGQYQVQAGDTLYSIATRFGVTVKALVEANQITDPNALRVGQELRIPGASASTDAGSDAGTDAGDSSNQYVHVVEAGETLFAIAQRYGVPLDQLASANDITNPNTLRVGQRLVIPRGGAAPSDSPDSNVRVHIVQPGETLTAIAARYGVAPDAIMRANGLDNPNRIYTGQQLTIP